jgi:hypothetical protein
VPHAAGVKMEQEKVAKVIHSEEDIFLSFWASSSVSEKFLLTKWNDSIVLTENVNVTCSAMQVERFSGRCDAQP